MDYTIVELPERRVVGLGDKIAGTEDHGMEQIGKLWQRFMERGMMASVPGAVLDTYSMFCVYHDYESLQSMNCDMVLGCESAADAPEGMVSYTIPAGKFMKFAFSGDPKDACIEAWEKIWVMEEVHKVRTGKIDFETYYPSDDPRNCDMEIFIGIR